MEEVRMKQRKIIPCLDMKDGKVVKGINFEGVKEIGDPVEFAKKYEADGADELVFLDISATNEGRKTMVDLAKKVADAISIPFTVGGGIATIEDIQRILDAGVTKVSIGTAGLKNPEFLKEAVKTFGGERIVLAVDAKRREDGSGWNVYSNGGVKDTGIDLLDWIRQAVDLGVGELLLTSIDADGMKTGYDLEMYAAVREITRLPMTASGGCGSVYHIYEAFKEDVVDAALAASVFHYDELTVSSVKAFLAERGIPVRL